MRRLFLLIALASLLWGCSQPTPPAATTPSPAVSQETDTTPAATTAIAVPDDAPDAPSTAVPVPTDPPTATPIPLAATINDTDITLAVYERELAKFQQWYPNGAPDGRDMRLFTLDSLIELELARQAAAQEIDPALIDQHVADSIVSNGGRDGFDVWLDQNNFADEQAYRQQVAWELTLQDVMGQLVDDLPVTAEYVRARYIEVETETAARQIKAQLDGGADFLEMIDQHSIDPQKARLNGDLGKFKRGTLFVPEIETAAFALDIMAISDVIIAPASDGTVRYFIIQTLEKEGSVPVAEQDRAAMLQSAYQTWLTAQKETAAIDVFIGLD